jgi:class 3 adenylate cyclase
VLFAPFEWLYRKLGARYPKVFVVLELQAGFAVSALTVLGLGIYYDARASDIAVVMAVALVTTGAALGWGLTRIYPHLVTLSRWIGGPRDEESTDRAWAAAVGLPMALVRQELFIPLFGVVLPTTTAAALAFDLPWTGFVTLVVVGMIAVGYGAILHHLTLETGLRPVLVEINRAVKPELAGSVAALPLRWRLLAVLPMINVITGLAVAAVSGADNLGVAVLAAIGVATTISLELTLLLTRSVMQPLRDLQRATDAVRAGDFEAAVPVTTGDEIGELAASFNDMVSGLRERERIRQAFGTYLDHEVAEYILSDGFSERGEVVEVSILFCDVRDFTRFAETAKASEVVACLNALFEVVVPEIAAEGGHVDKFEGDGLMAVFGAPQRFADHADRAMRAAVEINRLVNREGEGGVFEIGIGVNTGPVVAGSIGGAGRLNFSVIGDAVNVASRVEAATRTTGDSVLITAATREQLTCDFDLVRRGERELRGLERPIELFAVAGDGSDGASALPAVDAVRAVYARVRGNRGDD